MGENLGDELPSVDHIVHGFVRALGELLFQNVLLHVFYIEEGFEVHLLGFEGKISILEKLIKVGWFYFRKKGTTLFAVLDFSGHYGFFMGALVDLRT